MTLTRFLTAYIYNPLTLWLTRRRPAKGRSVLGARNATVGRICLSADVSLVGDNVHFRALAWRRLRFYRLGLLHGFYLTVNHAWRLVGPRLWSDRARYDRFMKPIGIVLVISRGIDRECLLSVVDDSRGLLNLLKGMIGLGGVALPQVLC